MISRTQSEVDVKPLSRANRRKSSSMLSLISAFTVTVFFSKAGADVGRLNATEVRFSVADRSPAAPLPAETWASLALREMLDRVVAMTVSEYEFLAAEVLHEARFNAPGGPRCGGCR